MGDGLQSLFREFARYDLFLVTAWYIGDYTVNIATVCNARLTAIRIKYPNVIAFEFLLHPPVW